MTITMEDINIQTGILAYQQGKKDLATSIFSESASESPRSAEAWYCLSRCLEDPEKSQYCRERAVLIDETVGRRVDEKLFGDNPRPPFPKMHTQTPVQVKKPVPPGNKDTAAHEAVPSLRNHNRKQKAEPSPQRKVSSRLKWEKGRMFLLGLAAGAALMAILMYAMIQSGYFVQFVMR
jgi:hypothetical protein